MERVVFTSLSSCKSSIEDSMDILIDGRFSEKSFDSFVREFHVYKGIWSPLIGEELNCKKEVENKYDKFAVAIYRNTLVDESVVGHVPLNLSKFFSSF